MFFNQNPKRLQLTLTFFGPLLNFIQSLGLSFESQLFHLQQLLTDSDSLLAGLELLEPGPEPSPGRVKVVVQLLPRFSHISLLQLRFSQLRCYLLLHPEK
ncbi:hypothetical protein RchiOBHm_Chr7g0182101 [Rosa chinensis]|uniref:Uncharacterized protein n=1 Tax=Rosa chinensis TaxID=74649 RepID=A0A2P6P2T3_ROSCH|nr:hypothetical protein RchiOBHm_Chr7g0182101 [Rosa chinensis]